MKYYEVQRNLTCKAIGSKTGYYQYDKDIKQFGSISEVKKFLKDTYGNCKKIKQYTDNTDGTATQTGIIYCYNTPKYSYDDSPKNNQDWVTVKEIKATIILI